MKKSKPKVKEKKKDEENFDFMKTNKDNIKNVLKDNNINPIITELVSRTNKIVVHSYQFLKLYFIYLFHNNQSFPTLDKEFICDIFKVITKRKCNSGGYRDDNMPEQLKTLTKFYKEHYSKTRIKKLTKSSETKYFAEPDDNFCMNVNRNHSSSGIYFQITNTGICQRCYCKKDTIDGRLYGPCGLYASKEITLNKTLSLLLFGSVTKGKKINKLNISRNSSTATLDLALKPDGNRMFSDKEICLENCKSILSQLEKELTN